MARAGWLNENANRSFPFLSRETQIPQDAVVDFGCLLGPAVAYAAGTHRVWLARISRVGSTFTFEFETDAPGVSDPLTFTRTLADKNTTEFSEVLPIYGDNRVVVPTWSGYLTTGSLEQLAEQLAPDAVFAEPLYVEPALVRSLANQFVVGIKIHNENRTKVTDDPGTPRTYTTPQGYLQGQVRLIEGYNCSIVQDTMSNSLTIGAEVGAGAGECCGEVPVSYAEAHAGSDALLDGSPRCEEVLRSINGQGGQQVNVVGGTGVSVTPEPAQHRLRIGVHMNMLEGCS